MERKYYLRGLGIGIAVTAIIMGISRSGPRAMTDDEIIARAKQLGMVENTVLANAEETEEKNTDIQEAPEEPSDVSQSGQKNPETGKAADAADANKSLTNQDVSPENETPTAADDNNDTQAESPTENDGETPPEREEDNEDTDTTDRTKPVGGGLNTPSTEDETTQNGNEIITSAAVKTITVNHGDGSYTVAKKLEDVGVVTSATTFDTFLCQNGYDKRLRTGTFSIPADASDEQIARIVTGAE